mgnify:CR=1 FL=1|jgi:hypothetical protein
MTHQRPSLSYVSGLISDPVEMVAAVSGWAHRFTPQEGPGLDDMSARYATFVADGGDYDTLKGFLALDLLPAPPRWLVLQQYQHGDYSLPRRLHMDLPVSREEVSWVATCPLTRDAADGVTIWGGDRFVRLTDERGLAVIADADAWYWTSPVQGDIRYAMTLGG